VRTAPLESITTSMHSRNRNNLTALSVLLFMASFPCFAQTSAAYRACSHKARTQSEMNACASKEAARVDAELNRVHNEILSETSMQPEATAKIKAAEQAWVAYRDAYMDAMYPATDKQGEYGSIYPMEANLLHAKLAAQHLLDLKQLLQQHRN